MVMRHSCGKRSPTACQGIGMIILMGMVLLFSACNSAKFPEEEEQESLTVSTDAAALPSETIEQDPEAQIAETITSVPDLPSLPGNAVVLDPDEYAINFAYEDLTSLSQDTALLFLNSHIDEDQAVDCMYTLEVSDWEGNREVQVCMDYIGNEDLEHVDIYGDPINEASSRILVSVEENYSVQGLYVLELSSGELWSFQPLCNEFTDSALVGDYIMWMCSEEYQAWYLIEMDRLEPVSRLSFRVTGRDGGMFKPVRLLGNDMMWPEFFNHEVCAFNLVAQQWVCSEYDYWFGPLSPDGQWVEVRIGDDYEPMMVGIMGTECLRDREMDCYAWLTLFSNDIPASDSYWYLGESTWLPDGAGILYSVELETDHSNNESDEREVWVFDIRTQEFERIGRYDLPLRFGSVHYDNVRYTPPWSPDGSSVVVSVGEQYYLLNIETGDLTPLTEGGVLLGTITLP